MSNKRILVADCFPPEMLPLMEEMGVAPIGETEVAIVNDLQPGIETEICYAADASQALPDKKTIAKFDGMLWSGTPLSVNDDVPAMHRQIALMQSAFDSGIPLFGICGGLQVAVVAAGGEVIRNPQGLESPVARQIKVHNDARAHPMFQHRDNSFDAFCDHFDLVTKLPGGGQVLASNDICSVQAASFHVGESEFWGVQYHPDFGFDYFRSIAQFRRQDWIDHGLAGSDADVDYYVSLARRLEENVDDKAAANILGIGKDIINKNTRYSEIRAWLETKIL